jgi:hypothetical protein
MSPLLKHGKTIMKPDKRNVIKIKQEKLKFLRQTTGEVASNVEKTSRMLHKNAIKH